MYKVVINKDVIKKSKKFLKPSQRRKLAEFLKALEENPIPKPPYDVKPVKSERVKKSNTYRFRLGDYRVFYTIYWDENLIVVTDIKPRESAYER